MNNNPEKKFYFKGKFFDNDKDFFSYVNEWSYMICTEEDFKREWEHIGKEIWLNICLRKREIKNKEIINEFMVIRDKLLENLVINKIE